MRISVITVREWRYRRHRAQRSPGGVSRRRMGRAMLGRPLSRLSDGMTRCLSSLARAVLGDRRGVRACHAGPDRRWWAVGGCRWRSCARPAPRSPSLRASIVLVTEGNPQAAMAASDGAAALEDLQFTLGEGPGVDAAGRGRRCWWRICPGRRLAGCTSCPRRAHWGWERCSRSAADGRHPVRGAVVVRRWRGPARRWAARRAGGPGRSGDRGGAGHAVRRGGGGAGVIVGRRG